MSFASSIIDWQKRAGRHHLPWQNPRTPYRVWVSETMLQQTQVQTVVPYFERFMERFPAVDVLAQASTSDVMASWSGLGYYSRARRLHEAARQIMAQGGAMPDNLEDLLRLPGIGRSTAGAILALGFNKRGVVLDGNVRRVLCRYFGVQGDPTRGATQKRLWELAEQLTPHEDNAAYVQGMMDLGATLCLRRKPDCANCPVRPGCFAQQNGCQDDLPARPPKTKRPVLHMWLGWYRRTDGAIAMTRRKAAGIWGGMHCLPELEDNPQRPVMATVEHQLTHRRLILHVVALNDEQDVETLASAPVCWYHPNQSRQWALPAPVAKLLHQEMPHGENRPLQKAR